MEVLLSAASLLGFIAVVYYMKEISSKNGQIEAYRRELASRGQQISLLRNQKEELERQRDELKKENKVRFERFQSYCEGVVAEEKNKYLREFEWFKKEYVESMKEEREGLDKRAEQINKEKESVSEMLSTFERSMLDGRKWLCNLFARSLVKEDDRDKYLQYKKRPASDKTVAEIRGQIKEEKQKLLYEIAFLESKIQTYQEYFPFLKAMEDEILEETIDITAVNENSKEDRAKDYLSKEEYANLSSIEKNQLALDRYMDKANARGIGMLYELFLGHKYSQEGYSVLYPGVEDGLFDHGRDLICIKDDHTLIVQAKCWSKHKEVRENTVCQLFGTMCEYKRNHPLENVKGVLCLQNTLSETGKDFAFALGIQVEENFKIEKGTFPTIKCNINREGERIYHLPFDQQFRKTKVDQEGEFMAYTVKEAEEKGFRRAFRYSKGKTT